MTSNYIFSRVSKDVNVFSCLVVFGVWFRGFYFEVVFLLFWGFFGSSLLQTFLVLCLRKFLGYSDVLLFSELILYSDFSERTIFHLHNYLKL